jgi:transposase
MLRIDEVHVMRHKVLGEGASIRQVALELGLSRNTVSKYWSNRSGFGGLIGGGSGPVWARVQSRLEELVAEWEPRTTAKQRLTRVRLYRALVEEGYEVGLTTINQYLRERRRRRAVVYVPLIDRAGDEAQVDFFEVTVELDGQWHKAMERHGLSERRACRLLDVDRSTLMINQRWSLDFVMDTLSDGRRYRICASWMTSAGNAWLQWSIPCSAGCEWYGNWNDW